MTVLPPDLPRWVEARACLQWGEAVVSGSDNGSMVIQSDGWDCVFVVGAPDVKAVLAAVKKVSPTGNVVSGWENAAWLSEVLPQWAVQKATLHTLKDGTTLPPVPTGSVRMVEPAEVPALRLGEELRAELLDGARHSPIAATLVDGAPVSFCYAGAITGMRWDVAIDTVEQHRRRGHAALCASWMIRHMRAQGKEPVWASLVDNPPSWKLARKLGFEEMDSLVMLNPATGRDP